MVKILNCSRCGKPLTEVQSYIRANLLKRKRQSRVFCSRACSVAAIRGTFRPKNTRRLNSLRLYFQSPLMTLVPDNKIVSMLSKLSGVSSNALRTQLCLRGLTVKSLKDILKVPVNKSEALKDAEKLFTQAKARLEKALEAELEILCGATTAEMPQAKPTKPAKAEEPLVSPAIETPEPTVYRHCPKPGDPGPMFETTETLPRTSSGEVNSAAIIRMRMRKTRS